MALGNETISSGKADPFYQFHAWRGIACCLVLKDVNFSIGVAYPSDEGAVFYAPCKDLTRN